MEPRKDAPFRLLRRSHEPERPDHHGRNKALGGSPRDGGEIPLPEAAVKARSSSPVARGTNLSSSPVEAGPRSLRGCCTPGFAHCTRRAGSEPGGGGGATIKPRPCSSI